MIKNMLVIVTGISIFASVHIISMILWDKHIQFILLLLLVLNLLQAGSLFMLLAIMVIYYNVGTTDFKVLSLNDFSAGAQKILWLGFSLSFADHTDVEDQED